MNDKAADRAASAAGEESTGGAGMSGPHATASILHADLDAFYASVEQRDNPALRGKPVVVGGNPDSRGVVAAASYEAREYGIHSAMPLRQAARRCPHAKFVSGRHEVYRQVSREVMDVFHRFTPLVEAISLDEAFLDVFGGERRFGSPEDIAREIRATVQAEQNLTISIGVATNKSVAKIASDICKPDGLLTVELGRERAFLAPLPVGRIWGVGPRTEERLRALGIEKVGQLAEMRRAELVGRLGQFGHRLHDLARGIDRRSVSTEGLRKSVGNEHTFGEDVGDLDALLKELLRLSDEVGRRLRAHELQGRVVTVKIRRADFTTLTRRRTLPVYTDDGGAIYDVASVLMRTEFQPGERYRLLGVHVADFAPEDARQMEMPLFGTNRSERLNVAVDGLESRFGRGSVRRGGLFRSVARVASAFSIGAGEVWEEPA
ncbi:MAG: DNA polymerase IV [Chloroflexota bacterium]|jgi:DNA polymerase-4|nr:DNA polymerase IV [Chloroflexota bacterium]MDP6508760.1 DNA polymerase IV [Chloroflexota bacterium]MDP6758127.1 DNA polymerase IV [Chloroflexota bacterium]